jgi:hypothetical protein
VGLDRESPSILRHTTSAVRQARGIVRGIFEMGTKWFRATETAPERDSE